jgi:prevent-host-death family protein
VATFPATRTVGLNTLKNKLSEYVRAAAAGETIVTTDRGRPVAKIAPRQNGIPIGKGRPLSAFELQGMREGWRTPARIRDGSPAPSSPQI